MPEISRFFGIRITINFNEHYRAHFHAQYGSHRCGISIQEGELLSGSLPPRQARLVYEWWQLHKDELMLNWERSRKSQPMLPIDPVGVKMDQHDVIDVEPGEGYTFRVVFDDGVSGIVDVNQWRPFRGVFEPLDDIEQFRRVFVDAGAVAWPWGLDIAPDVLYHAVRDGVDVAANRYPESLAWLPTEYDWALDALARTRKAVQDIKTPADWRWAVSAMELAFRDVATLAIRLDRKRNSSHYYHGVPWEDEKTSKDLFEKLTRLGLLQPNAKQRAYLLSLLTEVEEYPSPNPVYPELTVAMLRGVVDSLGEVLDRLTKQEGSVEPLKKIIEEIGSALDSLRKDLCTQRHIAMAATKHEELLPT